MSRPRIAFAVLCLVAIFGMTGFLASRWLSGSSQTTASHSDDSDACDFDDACTEQCCVNKEWGCDCEGDCWEKCQQQFIAELNERRLDYNSTAHDEDDYPPPSRKEDWEE